MLRSVVFWPPSRQNHTSNLVNTAASCPRWPYGTDLKCSPAWAQLSRKMQDRTSSDPWLSCYSCLVPKNLRAQALFLPDDGYPCIPRGAAWEQSNCEIIVENLVIKIWRRMNSQRMILPQSSSLDPSDSFGEFKTDLHYFAVYVQTRFM